MRRFAYLLFIFLLGCSEGFQSLALFKGSNLTGGGEGLIPRDYRQMVLAGYQGWFSTPGDGYDNRWIHWSGSTPRPGNVSFELYPNVSEYPASALVETQLGNLGNGQRSYLFSSKHEGVVDVHFRWMREYGIDGVAAQRFAVGLPASGPGRVLELVKEKAIKYGRYFHVTYDLSGANNPNLFSNIQRDWEDNIEGRLDILNSPNYARASGRPVVILWGIEGIETNMAIQIVRYLKNRGVYVGGGTGGNWRDRLDLYPLYQELNMIQPWTVGAYASDADIEANYEYIWVPDRQLTDTWGIDYQKVVWPGFSWSNWNGGSQNAFSRRAGQFMWYQARLATRVSTGLMIAMFDEYDEGTAIAKAAETAADCPVNQYFLSLDADGVSISSDFYLRLSGAITQLSRRQIPDTTWVPVPYR